MQYMSRTAFLQDELLKIIHPQNYHILIVKRRITRETSIENSEVLQRLSENTISLGCAKKKLGLVISTESTKRDSPTI